MKHKIYWAYIHSGSGENAQVPPLGWGHFSSSLTPSKTTELPITPAQLGQLWPIMALSRDELSGHNVPVFPWGGEEREPHTQSFVQGSTTEHGQRHLPNFTGPSPVSLVAHPSPSVFSDQRFGHCTPKSSPTSAKHPGISTNQGNVLSCYPLTIKSLTGISS